MTDHLREIRKFHEESIEPYKGKPVGCPREDVDELEQLVSFELPLAYKQYLEWMGLDVYGVFVGTNAFAMDAFAATDELAHEAELCGFDLPRHYLAFLMHQGYIFAWFELPKASDDPPVWVFSEGYAEKKPKQVESFTKFIFDQMKGLAPLVKELAEGGDWQ